MIDCQIAQSDHPFIVPIIDDLPPLRDHRSHQIDELGGCELIAFDVRHQHPLAVDHGGPEQMVERPFVRKEIQTEHLTDVLYVGDFSRQEGPRAGVRLPLACVLREHFRPIAQRIEADCEEDEVLAELLWKAPLQDAEVVGAAQTELRQRTTGVDERQRDDFSAELC
jgi:hypothetical protein